MVTLNFSILIHASAEKVWRTLWEIDSYREWTRVFSEGTYVVTEWKEGNKILFVSKEGDGMVSLIHELVPNKIMSFKHIGIAKNGQEQPLDEESKKWSGAMETYTLNERNGDTELNLVIDVTDEHEQYFRDTYPKAFEMVRSLSEK